MSVKIIFFAQIMSKMKKALTLQYHLLQVWNIMASGIKQVQRGLFLYFGLGAIKFNDSKSNKTVSNTVV